MGFKNIFKFKNLYLLLLGSLAYFYYVGSPKIVQWEEVISKYFGITKYLIYTILLTNYVTLQNKKKQNMLSFIMHFSYVFMLAICFILISYNLGLLSKIPNLQNLEERFLELSIFKYKLGLIATYLYSFLILNKNIYIFYTAVGVSALIILFMSVSLTNWLIINNLKSVKEGYIKRKKIEEEEALILEKIAIKEAIEKNTIEQIKKMEIARENEIKEQVVRLNNGHADNELDNIKEKVKLDYLEYEKKKKEKEEKK